MRIAVPLVDVDTPLNGGVSLVVAAAKLRTYELHEAAIQATEEGLNFDARHDVLDSLFECYLLVSASEVDGAGLFLAAELDSPVEYVKDVKASIGAFADDLQLFSMRPEPAIRVTDLGADEMSMVADEAGFVLPRDWVRRFKCLSEKHLPSPVWSAYGCGAPGPSGVAGMAVVRCACGNHASHGELCNACHDERERYEAAEQLAERLATATDVSAGSPKRPCVGDGLLRI